jgi:predicted DNA-binding antitoxin AbrB/MazE fold protein
MPSCSVIVRRQAMRVIPAKYEEGVFKPLEPVILPSGSHVEVSIPDLEPSNERRARLASLVGAIPGETLDRMEADIEAAFGRA